MLGTGELLVAALANFNYLSATCRSLHRAHVSHLVCGYIFRPVLFRLSKFPARRHVSTISSSSPTSLLSGVRSNYTRLSSCNQSSDSVNSVRRAYWEEANRAQKSRTSSSGPEIRLCSLGGWTLFVAVGFASGTVYVYQAFYTRKEFSSEEVGHSLEKRLGATSDPEATVWSNMTGELLLGRPGNLTPEQEEKLRELWIATLQVFGVLDTEHAKEVNGSSKIEVLNGPPKSEAGLSEKPKKRRIPLFGRKHKDSDTESTASSESSTTTKVALADTDDKYGQTKQFHDTLAQQTPESLRATFWSMVKHDHPDALLLRFLRARKWDVEKALIMMISTMNWRHTEMHVDDDIMKNGEGAALQASKGSDITSKSLGEDFLAQMRMGKSFLHGTDKSGRPMCFVRVRLHKQGEQSEASLERYTVFLIESARMVLAPPVDTACVVFDMTGFSLANMDYSPVKFMIKCFEANYPESLGVVLVHKSPWVFQGIWKIIKGWLDPVVASKVNFTNSVEDLEQFVAKGQIPKELGGDEDWAYHYIEPTDTENSPMQDTETRDNLLAQREVIVKQYEEVTLEWIDKSKVPEVSTIKDKRHKLATDLRDDYWKVDPYLRARSLYDRYGVLGKGGSLQFYPSATPRTAAAPEPVNGAHTAETSADDVD